MVATDAVPELWFNRVDAVHVGMETWVSLRPELELRGRLGYKTGPGTMAVGLRASYPFGLRRFELGLDHDTVPRHRPRLTRRLTNSAYMLIGGTDRYDYFRRTRGWLTLFPWRGDTYSVRTTLAIERHSSVEQTTSYDLLGRTEQPANPPIQEGILRALSVALTWENPDRRTSSGWQEASLEVEHTHPGWLGSAFSFTRLQGRLEGALTGTAPRRPWRVLARLQIGTALGTLPPQRFSFAEQAPTPVLAFGVLQTASERFYEGDHQVALYWDANLRNDPFTAIGLGMGWELGFHGAHVYTWLSEQPSISVDGPFVTKAQHHHEVGFSLNRILHVLRIGATWRLDRPGFRLGLTLARF